ncbi:MAG: hypothetical protein M1818_000482 [Claussenomyces sp. TS43310]|nr:MAG: hypothetical protein M1818_000482 [Claussenomyces sp. TS43310]
MSKRQFKSQASSSRVASGTSFGGFGGFGTGLAGSALSYLNEPPNLSLVTDANVVVALKNTAKKDSTTKTKGLEDLRAFVQAHPFELNGGVEQSIVDAWVKIYPRISIDNSRRVRELSHNLQYELLKSTRRRMERQIPNVVGAWLAGTYDRDRPVSRAANDGITSFLDTEDKVIVFWRKCQPQILQYAQTAIQETPQTLSDERTTSADDAQDKYDRVIGSSLSLVVNLLNKLSQEDIKKHQEAYDSFFSSNKTLWSFASSKNAFVRASTDHLLRVALDKEAAIIESDIELVSTAFVAEGLPSSQSGSSLAFLHALIRLTMAFPEVWTTAYRGKKSSLTRLRQFLEKGSQGGPAEFWQAMGALLVKLPSGVLPLDFDGAVDLFSAYRRGIASREEPRSNAAFAWSSYFAIVKHIADRLADGQMSEKLLSVTVFPVFRQFLRPDAEHSSWSVGTMNVSAVTKAFELCTQPQYQALGLLHEEWHRLSEMLTSSMLTSLPEQSKDHSKSQDAVVTESHRWFSLQAEIMKQHAPDSITKFLGDSSCIIIKRAVEILVNRRGKPYGAAGAVEAALRLTPQVIKSSPEIQEDLSEFFQIHLSSLITSPSSSHLISSLNCFRSLASRDTFYELTWQDATDSLLASPDSVEKMHAIKSLISYHSAAEMARKDVGLQEYLTSGAQRALQGDTEAWELFRCAITFEALGKERISDTINAIIDRLGTPKADTNRLLQALELLCQKCPDVLRQGTTHITVMTRLLALGETSDTQTSSRANALKSIIEASQSNPDSAPKQSPILQIIQENLEFAGIQSLSIETLVSQAVVASQEIQLADLFPKPQIWFKELQPLLEQTPNPSLALTNPLGGAVFLLQPSATTMSHNAQDLDGFSPAFRMALYACRLLSQIGKSQQLQVDCHVDVLHLLLLTVEIVNDQIGLQVENQLWSSLADPDLESQVQDFLSEAQKSLVTSLGAAFGWRTASEVAQGDLSRKLLARLLKDSNGSSAQSFYAGRALCNLLTNLVEIHGWQTIGGEEWLSSLDVFRAPTSNIFTFTAVLSGLKEMLGSSKLVNTLCNRLVSETAGASTNSEKTLGILICLNAILSVYEPAELPVVQTRLVFTVRQITSWMAEPSALQTAHASESCRSLLSIMPSIEGVYGSHWQISLAFCTNLWNRKVDAESLAPALPALYHSIRLKGLLQKFLRESEDKNDDLEDALVADAAELDQGLFQLLWLPRGTETQPSRIVDELLCRELSLVPISSIRDPSELYPLIASDFQLVQIAAFDVLHRLIRGSAEEISVQVILEKTDAQLPEELLSLLLDPPSVRDIPDDDLPQLHAPVRSYLLSWELVFDSYVYASYKVRNDYSEALKSGNYIAPLLDFISNALGHSAAQSLNLDKARITTEHIKAYDYKSASTETDERNMQWLLVNLYYQCLKFTPNLVKNWWIDCRSKQTRLATEAWTEKHFSPLVVSDTLDEVVKWSQKQESASDDEKDLIIKVSRKSREVYAGYEVDEMQMQIVIRLPAIYPLEGVKVDGVSRVAVSEKKWQSWLMITQGVITFSVSPLHIPYEYPFLTTYLEWLYNRRSDHLPQECDRCTERADGMCDLLFNNFVRQKDAGQTLSDLQEPVSLELLV